MESPHSTPDHEFALRRPLDDRVLFGVAAGIARHFDLDRSIVRLTFVALGCAGGLGVALYLAAWLLIPQDGSERSIADELVERYRIA